MDRIKGKVAIVTGAAGTLGKAQALLLAREGAKVVLSWWSTEALQPAENRVRGHGARCKQEKFQILMSKS